VSYHGTRVLLGACLLTLAVPLAAAHELLAVRDQNPLIRGLYLPVSADEPSAGDPLVQRFVLTLSNTCNIERSSHDGLRVDGEALELRWLMAWRPADRLRIRATVPLVYYGGGALDGVVDGWHEVLGLPDGSRSYVRGGDLVYRYRTLDATVQQTDSRVALGDSALEAGFELRKTDRSQLSAWVGVEAPTGDREAFTGNEAWDVGTWLEGGWRLTARTSLAARAGVVRPGSAAPLPLEARRTVVFGSLGATWEAAPALALQLQLDAHQGMLEDTDLRLLGEALQLTLGALYRSVSGWRWQLALTEDLRVNASPDFALQLSVHVGGATP
jgi:hypothetical protein